MNWNLPLTERKHLCDLAQKQAEYAALPIMEMRKKMWYDLNDGVQNAMPPVIFESWTFERDFLPAHIYKCTSEIGKIIEYQLLRNIRNFELLNDDKVMPDFFEINWFVDIDEFGVKIEKKFGKDSQNFEVGYSTKHPIVDLEKDFSLLKPASCFVDKGKTYEWKSFLEEIFGNSIAVKIRTNPMECTSLTNRAIDLMGMEAFYMAMMVSPDGVHKLMAYLRDNALQIMNWYEKEGLIITNNGNQDSFGTSFNFTNKLPSATYKEGQGRLFDFWGNTNSEETIGISPEMFKEFCFPYYMDVCKPMGLLYYGCCEAIDTIWDLVRQMPHLKKVSISAWCNQQIMGDMLRGTDIVYSRKPNPKFLGVDEVLDENAWTAYIKETLDATHGVKVEFINRDVYTVHRNLGKVKRAVELTRNAIDKFYKP